MPTKPAKKIDKKTGVTIDANDADNSRGADHPDADKVRNGEMSATQLSAHAVGDTDVIDLPGYVETIASSRVREETSK